MKRTIFIILVSYSILFSQNDLNYFINSALQNNPSIKEFENSKQISLLNDNLIKAENGLPKISLTANYQYFPYFNNRRQYVTTNPSDNAIGYDIGITNGGFYSAQLNVEKNLLNGRLIEALQNHNKAAEKSITNNLLVEQHNISRQVTDLYLIALQSQMIAELNKEVLKIISKQVEVTKKLSEKGLAKHSDYLLLEIEETNRDIECSKSNVEFKNNLYSLYSFCGIKDSQAVELKSVSLKKSILITESAFFGKYEADSLSLSVLQDVYETKYLPQLKIFFNTGLNAVELHGIQKKFGLSAGLDFLLPIYDGGQKDINRQQNIIGMKTINNYKNYFTSELQNQKKAANEQLKTIEQNKIQLSNQLKNYKTILELKKDELESGQISMVEYLTVLGNYVDLKKNQILTEVDFQTQINNYNYWNW